MTKEEFNELIEACKKHVDNEMKNMIDNSFTAENMTNDLEEYRCTTCDTTNCACNNDQELPEDTIAYEQSYVIATTSSGDCIQKDIFNAIKSAYERGRADQIKADSDTTSKYRLQTTTLRTDAAFL